MFYGCTSITRTPILPATTLASTCYQSMFYGCTSLTTVSALPATTGWGRYDGDYNAMFSNCTSLYASDTMIPGIAEVAWKIPGTGKFVTSESYGQIINMFTNCLGTRSQSSWYIKDSQVTYYTQNEL